MSRRILFFTLFSFLFSFSNAQILFEDSAASLGIDVSYGNSIFGGGVSFSDFDNDGWDDITYSSQFGDDIYFFKNNGGTFTRIFPSGIVNTFMSKQVIWVDYDNDGDKDFFVTNMIGNNSLYENDGSFNFTDISASSGLSQLDLYSYGGSFGDIDNDGDLDLFITSRDDVTETQRNYLYKNNNGVFTDITQTAGINLASELTFCAAFFDYDNDGDQDLYIANDKAGNPNRFYKNDGLGNFLDVSAVNGTDIRIDAMSTSIGDYNNDGWFDIYVTNTTLGNYFLKNNGDGSFTDVASSTGTTFNSFAWGASFLDADNDGNLDLYVSSKFDGSSPALLSAAFYHNQGNETFVIPQNIGFLNDDRESYANAVGDFNNDGRMDIIVMNDSGANFLWENKTTHDNNYIKIKLEGVNGNRDAIGSKIKVTAGSESYYRYTLCGEGYLGQNSNYEHVGVGKATVIDEIKVWWNNGTGNVETITNIPINQSIIIKEDVGVLSTTTKKAELFRVFPNPSEDGLFNVKVPHNEAYQLEVFDISGRRLLYRKDLQLDFTFDLQQFSRGVYFAKITTTDEKTQQIKLVRN